MAWGLIEVGAEKGDCPFEKFDRKKEKKKSSLGEEVGLQKHNNPSYISLIDSF